MTERTEPQRRKASPRREPKHDRPLPGLAAKVPGGTLNPTETQYHLFVERVRDYAIFLLDADGIVTHWGEGAERMKEFAPKEVVGRHLSMLYPPGGGEDGTAEEHLRAAAEEGEYIGEGLRNSRDRGLFPARVVLTSLWRDGRLYGFSKVTQDLTERKQVEERLALALGASQAASVAKSRFLATMSHEIRTPINAILGYADLLDLEISGPLNVGQRAQLDRLRASGRHLLELIEDVLDFSRVEADRLPLDLRSGRVAEVMDEALSLLRPQADAHALRLDARCDADMRYWGDAVRVRQILVNLVGNAIKFTRPGGQIRVTCGSTAATGSPEICGDGPWIFVRVQDTGIGIPEGRLADIFEPFVQVQGTLTREHEGTGLGLAISRRLARLQGGDIGVESRRGEGAAFTVWLPATQAAAGAAPDQQRDRSAQSLTAVGQHLSAASYTVVVALTQRLRVDPGTRDVARNLSRAELEDHTATFLSDVAQLLMVIAEDGADASRIAQDGHDFQLMLAERHGRQRRRVGFSAAALVREYEILREEVETVLRHAGVATGDAGDPALGAVRRLISQGCTVARAAHAHAAAAGA